MHFWNLQKSLWTEKIQNIRDFAKFSSFLRARVPCMHFTDQQKTSLRPEIEPPKRSGRFPVNLVN